MYCGKNETPEQFALRVKKAIEKLRDTHQTIGGNRIRGLLERFPWNSFKLSRKIQSLLASKLTISSNEYLYKHT